MDKLIAVVTGPEHSGTTLIEKILYSHPDIFGGFETGLLLNPFFSECKPFNEWIYKNGWHWGISSNVKFEDNLTFTEKYNLLYNNRGSYDNDIQKLIRESKYIVDKTPAYIRNLKFVRENVPVNIPILISIKDFIGYYNSYVVKRNQDINTFRKLISSTIENLQWLKKNKNNIYLFEYNDIVNKKELFSNKIKQIIKYKINIDFELSLEKYNEKILHITEKNYESEPYKNWKRTSHDDNTEYPDDFNDLKNKYNSLIMELKEKL